jgi:hypothetical protein
MIYFITDWHSASLKRFAFSSSGAELLAVVNAADRGLALTAIVRQFASAQKNVLFELTLNSRVLCAAKDETSVEFMRPLLNSWAKCFVVISC